MDKHFVARIGLLTPQVSATTISATTFYGDGSQLSGISTDNFYTTGATLSSSTVTFSRNDNNTYQVDLSSLTPTNLSWSAITNTPNNFTDYGITGGTISGLNISTFANANASSVVFVTSGGTLELGSPLMDGYITDTYTILQLTNTSNWDSNNTYIGPTITGVSSGQKYVNDNYTFEYVIDTMFRNAAIGSTSFSGTTNGNIIGCNIVQTLDDTALTYSVKYYGNSPSNQFETPYWTTTGGTFYTKHTFTAPPSGNIRVAVSAYFDDEGGTTSTYVGLHSSSGATTTPAYGWYEIQNDDEANVYRFINPEWILTGLSAGTVYTIWFQMISTGTASSLRLGRKNMGAWTNSQDKTGPFTIMSYDMGTVPILINQ